MRNLLLTVNHGNFLHPRHRESFTHAAGRWGCDYLEIPAVPGYHPCFSRQFFLHENTVWDRVCWIDGDCLINSGAPNPFEITDPSRICAVQDVNTCELKDHQRDEIRGGNHEYWYSILECPKRMSRGGVQRSAYLDSFINCGFVIASPRVHRDAFLHFQTICESQTEGHHRGSAHYEQALFNYCVHIARLPIAHLGREWNHLSPPRGDRMITGHHVWHFSGIDKLEQETRIGNVEWYSA